MRIPEILALDPGIGSTYEDYLFLYGLVATLRPMNIVEIGTNYGIGAITMALAQEESGVEGTVHTFDVKDYDGRAAAQVHLACLAEKIVLHRGTSADAAEMGQRFNFGLIDGDHSYAWARRDFQALAPICDFLAFHDADWPDVRRLMKQIGAMRISGRPGRTWKPGKGFSTAGKYAGWGLWTPDLT